MKSQDEILNYFDNLANQDGHLAEQGLLWRQSLMFSQKIKVATSSYAIMKKEEFPLFMYDGSIRGNGKSGTVFTNQGFYNKVLFFPVIFVYYSDIAGFMVDSGKLGCNITAILKNQMRQICFFCPNEKRACELIDMITSLMMYLDTNRFFPRITNNVVYESFEPIAQNTPVEQIKKSVPEAQKVDTEGWKKANPNLGAKRCRDELEKTEDENEKRMLLKRLRFYRSRDTYGEPNSNSELYRLAQELISSDSQTALSYLEEASENGYAKAQCMLADIYADGKIVPSNAEKAFSLYTQAAGRGAKLPYAQAMLGECYRTGFGVEKDIRLANKWFTKASQSNEPRAYRGLGLLYLEGDGENILKNPEKAISYFGTAVLQGDSESAEYLLQNLSVERAAEYFRKLFSKGNEVCRKILQEYEGNMHVVKVIYDDTTLQVSIIADGNNFDTAPIAGMEMEDWIYPFMVRQVKWDGFYKEMSKFLSIHSLLSADSFTVIFNGSDNAFENFCSLLSDVPVKVIRPELEKTLPVVNIIYDSSSYTTSITIDDKSLEVPQIQGKKMEDWIYPFMFRGVQWDGIFKELAKNLGEVSYVLKISGKDVLMAELKKKAPKNVQIIRENILEGISKPDLSNMECPDLLDYLCQHKWLDYFTLDEKRKIVQRVEQYANSGDVEAQYCLAMWYDGGLCGLLKQQDKEISNMWYARAIQNYEKMDNPSIKIRERIAEAYFDGNGVENDDDKAVALYKQLASEGSIDACMRLSIYALIMLDDQESSDKWEEKMHILEQNSKEPDCIMENANRLFKSDSILDREKALKLYNQLYKNGYTVAAVGIGNCYAQSRGIETMTELERCEKAIEWYLKAAESGHLEALFLIADVYKNINQKIQWYEKVGSLGIPEAYHKMGDIYYQEKQYENAFDAYQKSENSEALGVCYFYGHGVKIDYDKAFAYLSDFYKATMLLGDCYANGYGTEQDLEKAAVIYQGCAENIKELTERAVLNNSAAAYVLCHIYLNGGLNVSPDIVEAEKWYQKISDFVWNDLEQLELAFNAEKWLAMAMECCEENPKEAVEYLTTASRLGNADAQAELGECYYSGNGVEQDYTQAFKWFQISAKSGNTWAEFKLGYCYEKRLGTNKSLRQAKKYYEICSDTVSEQENEELLALVQSRLSLVKLFIEHSAKEILEIGREAYINDQEEKALDCYWEAFDEGEPEAFTELGDCYMDGDCGLEVDKELAVKFYLQGAEKGSAECECNLGNAYSEGNGVLRNLQESARWYEKAALHNNCRAQYEIGNCYAYGIGVQRNLEKAGEWLGMALASAQSEKNNIIVSKVRTLILKLSIGL